MPDLAEVGMSPYFPQILLGVQTRQNAISQEQAGMLTHFTQEPFLHTSHSLQGAIVKFLPNPKYTAQMPPFQKKSSLSFGILKANFKAISYFSMCLS